MKNLGRLYERQVYNVCRKLINPKGKPFCSMREQEVGKTSKDLECNYYSHQDVGIEIKKQKAPDWMQMSICKKNEREWVSKGKGHMKIPYEAKTILEDLLYGKPLYLEDPPFMEKYLSYEEWIPYKPSYKDLYIPCPPSTISDVYRAKKCQYIQVSEYGLYHTGEDVCHFGVPYFECEQRLRIRIKIHKACISYGKNKGKMIASVIVSPQPRDIRVLEKSPFTLDHKMGIPQNLYSI